jgi:hypothetical protein
MGYTGTKDTLVAQTNTDASGNFLLDYPKKYNGTAAPSLNFTFEYHFTVCNL